MNQTLTNGSQSKSNALSAQSEEVQRLMASQFAQSKGGSALPMPDAATQQILRDNTGASKFFDPYTLSLIVGIVRQIVDSAVPKNAEVAAPVSKGGFKQVYKLRPGHFETFPTWSFWGETNVSLRNSGTVPTTVTINDLRLFLNPGESTQYAGKWAAFPIRVTNSSELAGSEVEVEVW